MDINLESIIFYILLIDALGANLMAWNGAQAWWRSLSPLTYYFPLSRGWTVFYLFIVLIMGLLLYRNDLLVVPFT